MRKASGVDVVDGLEHLLEEILALVLFECARVCDVVEELSACDHLLSDVGAMNLISILFGVDGVLREMEVLYHVFVVELRGRFNFLLEQFELSLVPVGSILAEDFEGVLGSIVACAELDLGREA